VTYADAVALLRTYLLDPGQALPALTGPVASQVPDPRPDEWTQLRRIGGADLPPVREIVRIDAFSWALTYPAAWTLTELTRRKIMALKGTALLGPVVYRVETTMAPRQLDDELTGLPRYWATYALTIRADDVTP